MKIKRHDTSGWVPYFKKIRLYSQICFLSEYLRKVIVSTKAEGKILEVGSGSGFALIVLKDYGFDVVALDIDKDVVRNMKSTQSRFNVFFPIVRADMFNLPFKSKSFDTVFSQGVMEHFDDEDIVNGLIEQKRIANTLIMDVPTNIMEKPAYGDERLLPASHWKQLLKKAGLNVIRRYGWSVPQKYKWLWLFLPTGFWKLFGHYFSISVVFICKTRD